MSDKHTSFAAFFAGPGFSPEGNSNGLRFATEQEAHDYAAALFQRWTVPTGFEIRGTADPVNYRWNVDTRSAEALKTEA